MCMNFKRYVMILLVASCLAALFAVKKVCDARAEKCIALKQAIKKQFPVPEAQKEIDVRVRTGKELCAQEKLYLERRAPKVAEVLRKDFGITEPLRIGFACSGGGIRATIGTVGFCTAAARHKFLDASLYLTGLSGSTWAIAPWSYMFLNGLLSSNIEQSFQEFRETLEHALNYPCDAEEFACLPDALAPDVQMSFSENMAKHFAYDQKITVVDLYGAFAANCVLKKVGSQRLNVTWSSMAKKMEMADLPLLLCSSAIDIAESPTHAAGCHADYAWFESGPFEAGSTSLGFIPIWALGSTFANGKIIAHAPEYEMSEYLGMYGSAFHLVVTDIVDHGFKRPKFNVQGNEITLPVDTFMSKIINQANEHIHAKEGYKIHAEFANYSKGLPTSALKDLDQFSMFDAGNHFHVPLPLLFDRPERGIDVAIVYDSHPGCPSSLIEASRYFKKSGIAMPDIEQALIAFGSKAPEQQAGLLSKPMTVFNDPRTKLYDPKLPTLIYFPTPNTDISLPPCNIDLSTCPDVTTPIDNTKRPYFVANFKYEPADVRNLSATMEAVFESQVDEMKKILKLVSQMKLR